MADLATLRLHDGAELWTAVSGTGLPVVCLHGGPGQWDYLAPLAALLDDMFTMVRFDQRGCGRSTGRGPFTIEDLLLAADRVTCPVTMLFGADDPRPWMASDSLLAALPDARRIVFNCAGHAPWTERHADTRQLIIDALRPARHGCHYQIQ
jgi:pimeloyl-ACP methyl ester carboxylesterase